MFTSRSGLTSAWRAGAAACLLGLAGCTHLFYQPTDVMYVRDPQNLDKIRVEERITSADGTKLAAWWLQARAGGHKGLVVQFHGNGQNMTAHFASLAWLTSEGFDLMTFDYRGYGISEGKPTQEGVNQDAIAVMRFALSRAEASKEPVTLYGQSLGGAILMHAFGDLKPEERARIHAMVIESSFYSYKAIAREKLSESWLTFLLQPLAYVLVSDSTSPEDAIPAISPTPLLVVHGDKDPVVPLKMGRKIFELAREPKRFFLIPDGGHLTAPPASTVELHREVLKFLADPPRA